MKHLESDRARGTYLYIKVGRGSERERYIASGAYIYAQKPMNINVIGRFKLGAHYILYTLAPRQKYIAAALSARVELHYVEQRVAFSC